MHNIWLIAKREYLERVRTKGFLIITILIPLLMGGAIGGGAFLGSRTKTSSHIAIVSPDTTSSRSTSRKTSRPDATPSMKVDLISPPTPDTRAHPRQATSRPKPSTATSGSRRRLPSTTRPTATFYSGSSADIAITSALNSSLRRVLTRERLVHRGILAQDVDTLLTPVEIDTQQIKAGRAVSSNSLISFLSVYLLFFLMYFVILIYGMNVARSIIEEKTSRIFEVLLATIRPEEMLAGKILGVGAVGLTQVGIWMIAAVAARQYLHRRLHDRLRRPPLLPAHPDRLLRRLLPVRLHSLLLRSPPHSAP